MPTEPPSKIRAGTRLEFDYDLPLVAIIGGGFSAICLAAHLYRQRTAAVRIVVLERGPLGQGTAYRTTNPAHLLNGPAGNLSAFEDTPDDFVDFLRNDSLSEKFLAPDQAVQRQFVPRLLYRRYLATIVDQLRSPSAIGSTVEFIHAEVESIAPNAGFVDVKTFNRQSVRARYAVLAIGHPPTRALAPDVASAMVIDDPWDSDAVRAIPKEASVALIGSGQTASDMVLGLANAGHRGQITLLSRRGVLAEPYVHVDEPLGVSREELPSKLIPLMRWVRKRSEAAMASGGDWRAVVNALRPHTHGIWYNFSRSEKRAFFEHLAPYWNIHRTRLPPSTALRMSELQQRNLVRVVAGRVVRIQSYSDRVQIDFRRRGQRSVESLSIGAVINCTGPSWNVQDPRNRLFAGLLSSGIARWDEVRGGLDVTPEGILFDVNGEPSEAMFAVGPICKGKLLEIFAIRDIRVQCATLATRLLREACADSRLDPSTPSNRNGDGWIGSLA